MPLRTLVNVVLKAAPIVVNHQGLFQSVTISFNLKPGVAIGEAIAAIRKIENDVGKPASLTTAFQGNAQAFVSSLSSTPLLVLAALIVIYLILGILYESVVHPITILSTLPSAGLGALLMLMAFRFDLSVIAIVGIILLIGIVKKNGIMLIDFALDAERNQGLTPEQAIYRACTLRFRPISDDHHGGPSGSGAADAGNGCRLRDSAAPGIQHRRRTATLAAPDPIHDAGRLSLS